MPTLSQMLPARAARATISDGKTRPAAASGVGGERLRSAPEAVDVDMATPSFLSHGDDSQRERHEGAVHRLMLMAGKTGRYGGSVILSGGTPRNAYARAGAGAGTGVVRRKFKNIRAGGGRTRRLSRTTNIS